MADRKTLHGKTAVRKLQKEYASAHPDRMRLAFLLQDWNDAYNVGGMFRVADAIGAQEIVLSGGTPEPPNPMIAVTSMGNHRKVKWRKIERVEDAALALKAEGYTLVAIELAEGATSYLEYSFPEKTCLVLGNERRGLYGRLMKHVDASVFIPMYGKGRSLNVHVAAAVVAFDAVLRTRKDG